MIDLVAETPISLREAAQMIPDSAGRERAVEACLRRYITYGLMGIHLDAAFLAGHWYTSREAMQRFAEQITEAKVRGPKRTKTRQRSVRRAQELLEKMGI